MRLLCPILVTLLLTFPARGDVLSEHQWVSRLIIVFADTEFDPSFIRQMEMLEAELPELEARDVLVLSDTIPADKSELRQEFHPRGFQLLLIGKDGDVKLRKPFPWSVRELSRAIDKMPLRQQEILNR